MKTLRGSVKEDFDRDLYWTKIVFLSDDETKKTSVFVCASQEYLDDFYRIAGTLRPEQKHLDDLVKRVVAKWSTLGEDVFKQDVHYDVYANTQEGEANGLDFLLGKVQTS